MSVVTGLAARNAAREAGRAWGLWTAVALVLGLLPQVFASPIAIAVMNKMGIAVIFALSYNMLLGQGGMLSFGHAVYFGLGGFIAMHALNAVSAGAATLPVPLLPLAGGLGGLCFGILFGAISTNRAGTVFAMISLGVGELIAASSLIFDTFFGGEEGITGNRTKAPALAGITFTADSQVYYLIAFWVFVAAALMYAFSRTPVGRMANAVRDNPERAEFVGYSQRWVRFVAFCSAGFFAGIAGGLFAVNYEILTEENLSLVTSGQVLLMTYIGGVGFFIGPVIGAIVFTFLQSMLSDFTRIWLLYLGVLFLATVMFVPTGLAGILMMHEPARRAGRLDRLVLPYLGAGTVGLAAAVGIIGLLELAYFRAWGPAGRTVTRLFWVTVDVASAAPWLAFAALAAAGIVGLWRAAPRVAAAWGEANAVGREDAEP
jgi:branched-chain amino acid transport system permease protein